ncbi:response regulator [Flavobacterium sp. MAHUQ-51]|uniref:response regulator n=1 Tax=Flavobacterium sp. GCM10022190 TaxID=3252639 RepID=UPI0036221821
MEKLLVICIVDDDDVYKFTLNKTIESQNFANKIMMFSDGEEAIDFLSENLNDPNNLPDVIFLDINMPIMDGFEFMEEYIKIKPYVGKKIIIYMVTSSIDPIDIERSKAISEISDYIVKPIDAKQLAEIVENLETSSEI